MRRKEREVLEKKDLLAIIDQCKVCRVATQDRDGLYMIPLNFGYEYEENQLTLFFHSAKEGRKVDAFAQNEKIAFEMDCGHGLVDGGEIACKYSFAFQSITGNGTIQVVEALEEKKRGLTLLMKHQTGKEFLFQENMTKAVLVYKVLVTNFTGKQRL